jgi:hypothetical protein
MGSDGEPESRRAVEQFSSGPSYRICMIDGLPGEKGKEKECAR